MIFLPRYHLFFSLIIVIFYINIPPSWGSTINIGQSFSQPIPAHGDGLEWMSPVSLIVSNHAVIKDLDVYFDITHTNVVDLDIFLDCPWGQTIMLKDDALMKKFWKEAPWQNMYGTIFDDQSDKTLTQGLPPYTGHFLPAQGNSLSLCNGHDINGIWTLRIFDMAYGNMGDLDRWELHFDINHAPEPSTIFLFILVALFLLIKTKPTSRKHHHSY